jgi:hypothetical protein
MINAMGWFTLPQTRGAKTKLLKLGAEIMEVIITMPQVLILDAGMTLLKPSAEQTAGITLGTLVCVAKTM